MPKLPTLAPKQQQSSVVWSTDTGATHIATYLARQTLRRDGAPPILNAILGQTFAAAVRVWFEENPSMLKAFTIWYEQIEPREP